ncbi:MAG: HAMP domain-containing histidine kinase [Hyphomicrobiales bacterium]|nr:MAG: HAMP domain-containing histidine kinase [Hyphomicrobiales bacterium]
MNAEWITSPTARRILMHWADPRPAWLWSQDGGTLLWRNAAARLFAGKIKKHGPKLADAVPIKGQVARLIRLGSVGRSSLSRVQFIAGEKPVSTTCSCTPLPLPDGTAALLLVGVDPIDAELRESAGDLGHDALADALFPAGLAYELRDGPVDDAGAIQLKAGPQEQMLVFRQGDAPAAQTIDEVREEEGASADENDERDLADMPEPMLPMGIDPLPAAPQLPVPDTDHWVEPMPAPSGEPGALSSLFDRLAGDADLYTPLTAADEEFKGEPPAETVPDEMTEIAAPEGEDAPALASDVVAAVIEYADDPEAPEPPPSEPAAPPAETRSHWLITGRGFRTIEGKAPVAAEAETPAPVPEVEAEVPTPLAEIAAPPAAIATVDQALDAETAERVSRYNFEELGRILSDRVAAEPKPAEIQMAPAASAASPGGVVSLNAETLVLNRLPLAILVFRDQQVLFANRALTDLLGHESVESLRVAGIASIFPVEGSADAGPVNRLVRRDGTPLQVNARLQSVSWQGRAALMLSASPAEAVRGHEGAVRAFAEMAAETRGEGFVAADRAGMITAISVPGRVVLGKTEFDLIGKPIGVLVGKDELEPLRAFLEQPARFAETTRPHLTTRSEDGEADIVLFAEGQAGIVTGYFGFVRQRALPPAPVKLADDDLEPGMLGRLSRGIRRPLNTIIGFADLIRSSTIGGAPNDRATEYARDIRTAGLEIAVLADELDDFTRLRDGRYAARPSDVDLGALLESCMVRVKAQAGAARVLVRSAISEKLPRIHADRSSLGQALLNLLASAIDQTPIGGSVILSAQAEEDGSIAIHVRDGAQSTTDIAERFVVFRDGVDKDGERLAPVRSSVGLALTRSLLAVNACSLSVDPTVGTGTLFSLLIPADLVEQN